MLHISVEAIFCRNIYAKYEFSITNALFFEEVFSVLECSNFGAGAWAG